MNTVTVNNTTKTYDELRQYECIKLTELAELFGVAARTLGKELDLNHPEFKKELIKIFQARRNKIIRSTQFEFDTSGLVKRTVTCYTCKDKQIEIEVDPEMENKTIYKICKYCKETDHDE